MRMKSLGCSSSVLLAIVAAVSTGAFGGETAVSNLAECFSPVDNAWIDTGVKPTSRTRVVFKFALTGLSSATQLCGYQAGANAKPQFTWGVTKAGKFVSTVAAQQQNMQRETGVDADLEVHAFDLQSGVQKFDSKEYAWDAIGDSATGNLYVLSMRNEWTSGGKTDYYCMMRVYECKIYDTNGTTDPADDTLQHDYRCTMDGELVDLVPDATPAPVLHGGLTPDPDRIADSFTPVSGAWIDTGVTPTSRTRVVFKFALTELLEATRFSGYQANANAKPQFTWGVTKDGKFVSAVAAQQQNKQRETGVTADLEDHVFDLQSGVQTFDGTEYAWDTIDDSATGALYVLAMRNEWAGGAAGLFCEKMRVYECKIYDTNGTTDPADDTLQHDYRCTAGRLIVDVVPGATPAPVLHGTLQPSIRTRSAGYTWQSVGGDWSGAWTDAAHWRTDGGVSGVGYPSTLTDLAKFDELPENVAVTCTVSDALSVQGFVFTSTNANLTMRGAADGARIDFAKDRFDYSSITAPGSTLTVSGLQLNLVDSEGVVMSELQMGAGERIIVRDDGVLLTYAVRTADDTEFRAQDCDLSRSYGSLTVYSYLYFQGTNVTVGTKDAKMYVAAPTYQTPGTSVHRFEGAQPAYECWNPDPRVQENRTEGGDRFVFALPRDPYPAPVVRRHSSALSDSQKFPSGKMTQKIVFEIDRDSPAYSSGRGARTYQLLYNKRGVNADWVELVQPRGTGEGGVGMFFTKDDHGTPAGEGDPVVGIAATVKRVGGLLVILK